MKLLDKLNPNVFADQQGSKHIQIFRFFIHSHPNQQVKPARALHLDVFLILHQTLSPDCIASLVFVPMGIWPCWYEFTSPSWVFLVYSVPIFLYRRQPKYQILGIDEHVILVRMKADGDDTTVSRWASLFLIGRFYSTFAHYINTDQRRYVRDESTFPLISAWQAGRLQWTNRPRWHRAQQPKCDYFPLSAPLFHCSLALCSIFLYMCYNVPAIIPVLT